jgi:chemotaxis signal transduction protein
VAHVAPRRLPGQPLYAGVAVVRGRVLPTVDAALRLGIPAPDPPRRMVLVATRGGVHAVSVTDASDITDAEAHRSTAPPAGSGASPCVAALVEIDGELVVVLDPDELCTA